MSNISLLPPELKQKRETKKRYFKVIVGVLGIFLVYGVLISVICLAERNVRGELFEVAERKKALELQELELQEFELQKNKLFQYKKIYIETTKNYPLWDKFLIDIAAILPNGVWMTDLNLDFQESASSGKFILRGYSYGYLHITKLLENLKMLNYLQEVSCDFSVAQYSNEETLIQYEVSATIQPNISSSAFFGGLSNE